MSGNKLLILGIISVLVAALAGQTVKKHKIGHSSKPADAAVKLTLVARIHNNPSLATKHAKDIRDMDIYSPKSALVLSTNKLYINSLEGFSTVVFDLKTLKKLKTIKHQFTAADKKLFMNDNFVKYKFLVRQTNVNVFKGKPVEMCLSHDGRYLWTTYYRKNWDRNSLDPSAVAIIDTRTDKIVRVMATGLLPKIITASPDNTMVAVTCWGDNTVHIIDISGNDVSKFKYNAHYRVGLKMKRKYTKQWVNRDAVCGNCLRGTVFTPDSRYLLVARMGNWGIALIDLEKKKYIGTGYGMDRNIRHLLIRDDHLYMSANAPGLIQRGDYKKFVAFTKKYPWGKNYHGWESCYVGKGARTFVLSSDGKYLFAAAYFQWQISVVDTAVMKRAAVIKADPYPVGLAITPDDKYLISTSQPRQGRYGNVVCIYRIDRK